MVSISGADLISMRLPAATLSAGGKDILGSKLVKKFIENTGCRRILAIVHPNGPLPWFESPSQKISIFYLHSRLFTLLLKTVRF